MKHWQDILANGRLKCRLKGLVEMARVNPPGLSGQHTLVVGPSRTGKSSTIQLAIKTMFCSSADNARPEPCNSCEVCRTLDREGVVDRGLLAQPDVVNRGLLYVPFDGNNVTHQTLHQEILGASQQREFHHLFYIDEVYGLKRRQLDHGLLVPIEANANITWIVSTANVKGLDPMFRNRFHQVRTELPDVPELAMFLCDLCVRPEFNLRWEDEDTLFLLAERSHRIVGAAIKCLRSAQIEGMLTRKYVEDYQFEPPIED